MKIRTGFVSNSSTSSFCIYGMTVDLGRAKDVMRKIAHEKVHGDDPRWEAEDICLSDLGNLLGNDLKTHEDDYSDCMYIGRTFYDLGLNETGKEFFERTEKDIKAFLDIFGIKEEIKCDI